MFRFPLNLRALGVIAAVLVAALVPAVAQNAPGVINEVLAVGTVGYGVIEAGDGNFYAMSLPGQAYLFCANNANQYCAYIYQITKSNTLKTYHAFQPGSSANATPTNMDGLEPTALITGTDGNLYGACKVGGPRGFGTIFKITPDGTLTVLVNFGVNAAGT